MDLGAEHSSAGGRAPRPRSASLTILSLEQLNVLRQRGSEPERSSSDVSSKAAQSSIIASKTSNLAQETSRSDTAALPDISELDARMQKHLKRGKASMAVVPARMRERRNSVKPSASMVQVLERLAKEQAEVHVEATIRQAETLANPRGGSAVPAAKRSECGASKLSNGLDAVLSFEALTQVWAEHGTAADLHRPENNAMGLIHPGERDIVTSVMEKAEAERVKRVLRKHAGGVKPKPTVPRAPRIKSSARHSRDGKTYLTQAEATAAAQSPMGLLLSNAATWDGTLCLRLRDKSRMPS